MSSTTLTPGEPGPEAPRAPGTDRRRVRRGVAQVALPLHVLVVILVAAVTTPAFFTLNNGRAVLINSSVVGILAVGMTPITLSGNFVSLGGQGTVVLATMTLLALLNAGVPIWLAVVLVLALQIVVAVLLGAIVSAGLNPVITTLAAGSVIYGVLTVLTKSSVVTAPGSSIRSFATAAVLGLPLPVYLFIVYTLVMALLLGRTRLGRQVTLLGANPRTAALSGISARTITIWAFISFGVAATLVGVTEAAELGQVTAGDLSELTINIVAAVLVGGISIKGGEGSAFNSALGAVLIAVFDNILSLKGVDVGVRATYVGLLVLVVVATLHTTRRSTR
jgi:ribose transport system permease protein